MLEILSVVSILYTEWKVFKSVKKKSGKKAEKLCEQVSL